MSTKTAVKNDSKIKKADFDAMAHEEITERQRELTFLLKISEQAAEVRDFRELFTLMIEEIRPLLGFDDFVITFLSEDSQKYKAVVSQSAVEQNERAEHSIFVENMYRHLNVADDPWMTAEKIYERGSPSYHTVAAMIEKYPAYHWAQLMRETGLAATITMTLRHRGKVIGALFVHFKEEFQNSENLFPLVEAVANQLATTVANITANEEILEREREKSRLLEITELIAQIKAGDDLLRLIVDKIRPLFGFEDCGLFVVSADQKTHTDLAAAIPGVSPSEFNERIAAVIPSHDLSHPSSALEFIMRKIEMAGKPVLFDFVDLVEHFPDYPQFVETGILELGYRDCLAANLVVRGESIGMFCINALEKDFFQPQIFPLFQAVTHSISIAVANILANEEILERTREKSVLLSISEDIAAVRDKRDLLQTIIGKVKPLFGFYDCGIMILDKDRRHFQDWAVLMPDIDFSHANDVLAEKGFYRDGGIPYENSLLQILITELEQAGQPIIWDYEKEQENFSDGELIAELKKLGYKEGVATLLRTGGEIIGAFFINSMTRSFFRHEQFGLLQGVADQIAVAVSNILANEEILEREREKTVLLSISEDIASARNAVELMQIIREKAQRLIPFYDTGILIVEDDGEHHYDLAVNLPGWDTSESNRKLQELGLRRMTHPDSYVEFVMRLIEQSNSPVIEHYKARYLEFNYPFFQILDEAGHQEGIVTSLKSGGRTFGTLWLNSLEKNHFKPEQFEIFQTLADQVAVAVANILANEEIFEREREKSVLLAITEQIAVIRDKNDLFRVIAEKLKPIFDFDEASTVLFDQNFQYTQNIKGINSIIRDDDELHNQLLAEKTSLENSPYQDILHTKTPLIIKVESVAKRYPDFIGVKIVQSYGLREFVAMPLRYAGKLLGVFEIYSLEDGKFQPSQIPIYAHLADQIAVAISNILANEEILEREREKTMLLSISEAIATVRDKDELFGIFNQKLRPILGYDYASVLEVDNVRRNYRYYLTISDQSLEANELYKEAARFRPFNPFIESALDSATPVTYLTDELLEQYPNGAGLKLQQSLGVKQSVVFVLKNAGQIVGLFILHYKAEQSIKSEQFPLFRNIANQIAVALGNILANEEIERQLDEIKQLKTQLEVDNSYLVEEVKTTYNFEEIIGSAPKLRAVFEQIELVAPTNATVLLEGETGTGKELFARAIHNLSPRSKRPLIKVNCACLPTNLVESELFGHERGSFTGATERRIGKFELAHNSTIFLDEIGELPLELQAKLLRVLQEQELERIGGKSAFKLDIRVIAATNRNLREEVAARRFRSDLYFRLNTVTLTLPPLRERREDVPALAMHFVEKYASRTGKRVKSIATNALQELMSYDFPGNIRELEHLIEESVIFCKNEKLVLHRPLLFDKSAQTVSEEEFKTLFTITLADHEREHILTILRQTSGRVRGASGAAEILNVKPTTLEARMKRLGIEKRHIFEPL